MEEVLISIASPPSIDTDIFIQWNEGKTAEEVFQEQVRRNTNSMSYSQSFSNKNSNNNILGLEFQHIREYLTIDMKMLLKEEIYDQYRMFQILAHYLGQPLLLRQQSLSIVSPDLHSWMIERYWSLDDLFIRELVMNNKRVLKSRKDLEEVSEITGLNIRRITRQFDNIKRIYSHFEDLNFQGNMYTFLVKNYLLTSYLARKYSMIIFLQYSKFNLSSKRRMQRISWSNMEDCAVLLLVFLVMDNEKIFRVLLTDSNSELMLLENSSLCWQFVNRVFPLVDTIELDKELLTSLRSLRSSLSGEALDKGTAHVKQMLSPGILKKLEHSHHHQQQQQYQQQQHHQVLPNQPPLTTNNSGQYYATYQQQQQQQGMLLSSSPSKEISFHTLNATPPQQISNNTNITHTNTTTNTSTSTSHYNPHNPHLSNTITHTHQITTSNSSSSSTSTTGYTNKLRNLLKSLLTLAANLSQSREYRDVFEDILTKVLEPLEETRLTAEEIDCCLRACYHLLDTLCPVALPEYRMSQSSSSNNNSSLNSQSNSFDNLVIYGTVTNTNITTTSTATTNATATTTTAAASAAGGGNANTATGATASSGVGGYYHPSSSTSTLIESSILENQLMIDGMLSIDTAVDGQHHHHPHNVAATQQSQRVLSQRVVPPSTVKSIAVTPASPWKASSRAHQWQRDWLRFITFIRLCCLKLLASRHT